MGGGGAGRVTVASMRWGWVVYASKELSRASVCSGYLGGCANVVPIGQKKWGKG